MTTNTTIPQFKIWSHDEKLFLSHNLCLISSNNTVWYMEGKLELLQNVEICRFIGLFDKNDIPIYEGYISSCKKDVGNIDDIDCGNGLIEYLERFGHWNISNIENCPFDLQYQGYTLEIIGNKFQNPELIGGGV